MCSEKANFNMSMTSNDDVAENGGNDKPSAKFLSFRGHTLLKHI